MNINVKQMSPGVHVVNLHGDVDMSTSPEIRKVVAPIFNKETSRVIVDLSQVPYMDSSGIATLIEGLQQSQKWGIRFILVGMTAQVEAAFDLAHLKEVFEVLPDLESALQTGGKG